MFGGATPVTAVWIVSNCEQNRRAPQLYTGWVSESPHFSMDTLSPLILLHGNGYKALAATNGSDDSRPVTGESQGKAVRVGEGDLDGMPAGALHPNRDRTS